MTTACHDCVYKSCYKNNRLNKNISFFKFPISDIKRTQAWQKNCGNPDIAVMDIGCLRHKTICEVHFAAHHVIKNSKRKLLTKTAVPLPSSDSDSEEVSSIASEPAPAATQQVINVKPPNSEFFVIPSSRGDIKIQIKYKSPNDLIKTKKAVESTQKTEPTGSAPLPTSTVLLPVTRASLQPSTSTTAPATTDPLIKLEEPSCSRIQEPGIDTTLEFLPEPSEQPVVNVAPKPKPIYKGRKDRIYCRLCLKTSNKNSLTPLSIHDFNYPGKSDAFKKKKAEKVEEIHKMIKFCLPFFDSLTFNPIICSICLARLRSSYDFANECLKNQRLVEKYADMYGTTERVININEMVESKFALSEDESDSDTDTEDTTQSIPKVTRSSTRVSKQIIDEDHSHEDSPATKKQKIYNESREDSSLASSNEDTPFIKTEPYEEFLAQDMPIRDIDPDGIDNITDESMIKIEPEYIDAPDFIKSEPVDDLHVENEIFNKRTGIGTEIQEQHSRFPKIENVVLDTGTNVPSVTREPVFMNVDSSLEATTSDLN